MWKQEDNAATHLCVCVCVCLNVPMCVFMISVSPRVLTSATASPGFFTDRPPLVVVEMKGILGTHLML